MAAVVDTGGAGTGDAAPREIVVGVDGTADSRAALCWAVDQAGPTGARVRAVAGWAPAAVLGAGPVIGAEPLAAGALPVAGMVPGSAGMVPGSDGLDGGAMDAALQDRAGRWLSAAMADLPPDPQRQVDLQVAQGDAATVMLDAAENAELLVIGNAGRGALAGAVTGSVALRCAHHARCPVVLVPSPSP